VRKIHLKLLNEPNTINVDNDVDKVSRQMLKNVFEEQPIVVGLVYYE